VILNGERKEFHEMFYDFISISYKRKSFCDVWQNPWKAHDFCQKTLTKFLSSGILNIAL
jgi:hypothetical protein